MGLSGRFPDVNKTGVEFILIDLDTGLTFMDVADASKSPETKARNYKNARRAYDAIVHLLEKLTPNLEQCKIIEAKLDILKARLQAVGQQF